jgi:hypothetical protein
MVKPSQPPVQITAGACINQQRENRGGIEMIPKITANRNNWRSETDAVQQKINHCQVRRQVIITGSKLQWESASISSGRTVKKWHRNDPQENSKSQQLEVRDRRRSAEDKSLSSSPPGYNYRFKIAAGVCINQQREDGKEVA